MKTQIKDSEGILYDVNYDCDCRSFLIWEHDKINIDGGYFTGEELKHYIKNGQIKIVKDEYGVFKEYL